MLGWKAYAGHPVYSFMTGNQDLLTEDIRANTETGTFYKYAYIRDKAGFFVQIGVLADKVNDFLHVFGIQRLIKDFMGNDNVEDIIFTDVDYQLIASGTEEYAQKIFSAEDIREHFTQNKAQIGRRFAGGKNALHVCAPVFYNGEKIGTLTVVWNAQIIDDDIKLIITDNIIRLIIISVLLGGVLYYAYRKNKSNLKVAFYDKLTGLPNDDYLKEYLTQKIKNCEHKKTAVLLLNYANFSLVNLTYGFEYGDNILGQMAKGFADNLSAKDMLFRLDADKFIIVVNDYKNTQELNHLSERILKSCKNPAFDIHKHEYLILKIAIYELDDKNISVGQVLHNTSLGIAALKQDIYKNHVIYNREMKEALLREELIEKALISIIEGDPKNSFYMEYQPLFAAKTGKIIAFEALARITIEDIGRVSSSEFIDLAERRNLIFSLGNIILKEVLDFLCLLKDRGYADTYVSVNISGLQLLRNEFIDSVQQAANIPPEYWKQLIVEITESVLVTNFNLTNEKLKKLKKMGMAIALDDFGTGYSSLTELRDLDIDLIKIDRGFIERIGRCDENALVTRDVITMSHRLGLKVVAEGVENESQMNYLLKHNCDFIQGYYFCQPLSKSDALNFLKSHHAKRKLAEELPARRPER